ncbi:MAG: extracellular solute-binding protein [Ktedonobacteraceae bacterium]|nr:extracellular solute-binding protein [Ktedonobacteraceae bacterium]MBO0791289.1 extracellular solute-binding protein [Ktedonobacteraceae bacterium]
MTSREKWISRRDAIKILGTGALSLGMLSSCGGSSSSGGKPQGDVTVWYYPFGVGVEQLYAKFVQEFQHEYPDIKIKLQLQPFNNRNPKILSAIAAHQGPDVVYITTDPMIRFAEAKAIAPLDDLLPKNIWSGIVPASTKEVSYKGSHWYLPIWQELPVWLYTPSLLEQVGWDPAKPPATWDDMSKLCEQAKSHSLFGWGYNAGSVTLNDTFYPFLYQAGGRPFSPDGKHTTFNSEAGVEALTYITELFAKGWSPQAYMSPISDQAQSPYFQKQQIVSIQYKQNQLIAANTNFPSLKVQVLPVLKQKEQWGFGALAGWAISGNAKNKEAAAAWLSFLARPEIALRHCEAFGEMPVIQQAATKAFKNNPELKALDAELPMTFGEQKHKYGRDIMPLVIPEIQAAITRQKTPKQALDDAASKADNLLAKG